MPNALSPASATDHSGAVEITLASTNTACRNGWPCRPYCASISAYDPAWISVAQVLQSYVPVPPAEISSPPTSAAAVTSCSIDCWHWAARSAASSTIMTWPS